MNVTPGALNLLTGVLAVVIPGAVLWGNGHPLTPETLSYAVLAGLCLLWLLPRWADR